MRRSPWPRKATFPPHFVVLAVLALAVVGGIAAEPLRPPPQPLSGRAEVFDGDTLTIDAVRIRLLGLDAPEIDQTCTDAADEDWLCGSVARSFVIGLVRGKPVTCAPHGRDRYGRTLAQCSTADGDLGAAIVTAGWAVVTGGWPISLPDYGSAEAAAREAGRGIWSGTFVAPSEWRRTHGAGSGSLWDRIRNWFQ